MKTLRNVAAVLVLGASVVGSAAALDMSTEGYTFSADNPAVVIGQKMMAVMIAQEVGQMQQDVASAPVVPVSA